MTSTSVISRDAVEDDLEGDFDVALAPIAGQDERNSLPNALFQRKPSNFLAKFLLASCLIIAGWAAIAFAPASLFAKIPVVAIAIIINGLMYSHLIELQHECLHGHAFHSPRVNRLFGVVCGIFMMTSYSHYRYDHLRHHAYLGSSRNLEHFNYRFQNLDSLSGFTRSFFDLSRYKQVIEFSLLSFTERPIPDVDKKKYNQHIKQEYAIYFIILMLSIAFSVYAGTSLILLAWWIPALLVSEGVHFMIEMPEHFGLNTQTDADVLTNTRTIRTSPLVSWFVNGNDIHTAHHYHQGVPMCNVRKLNSLIEDKIAIIEPSYRSFFWNVVTGKIRQRLDETCMNR